MLILSASILSYPSQLDPADEDPNAPGGEDPGFDIDPADPEKVYNKILYKKGQTNFYTDSRSEAVDAGGITCVLFVFNRNDKTSKTVTAQKIDGFKMLYYQYNKVNSTFPVEAPSMGFVSGEFKEDAASCSMVLNGQLQSGAIGYNKGSETGTVVLSSDEVDSIIAQFPDKYTVSYT